MLRVTVPPLSEERRRLMVGQVKETAENQKVAVRNIRRDANKKLDDEEKAKKLSEDLCKRHKDEVQKLTSKFEKQIEDVLEKKTKEVMEG